RCARPSRRSTLRSSRLLTSSVLRPSRAPPVPPPFPTRRSSDLGSRLPIEKDLAEALGVSRGSLREGVRALALLGVLESRQGAGTDRKSTRLNSSHVSISYAVFCLKKKR